MSRPLRWFGSPRLAPSFKVAALSVPSPKPSPALALPARCEYQHYSPKPESSSGPSFLNRPNTIDAFTAIDLIGTSTPVADDVVRIIAAIGKVTLPLTSSTFATRSGLRNYRSLTRRRCSPLKPRLPTGLASRSRQNRQSLKNRQTPPAPAVDELMSTRIVRRCSCCELAVVGRAR